MRAIGTLFFAFVFAVLSTWTSSVSNASPPQYSPERIEADLVPSAIGLGPRCQERAVWGSPRVRQATHRMIALADVALRDGYAEWSDDAYLEYSRKGVRINFEKIIFDRVDKLISWPSLLA